MGKTLGKDLFKHRYLYLLLLPTVLFYVLFQYVPMYGVLLAFKEFNTTAGILSGPWVGMDNFKDLVGRAISGGRSGTRSTSAADGWCSNFRSRSSWRC